MESKRKQKKTKQMEPHNNENDDDSVSVLSLSNASIQQEIRDVLAYYGLHVHHMSPDWLAHMCSKLKGYRVVMDWNELKLGAFIRGIDLTTQENQGTNQTKQPLTLNTFGFVCDIVYHPRVTVKCKTHTHRYYKVCIEDCLVFQKLSLDEQLMLDALDYANRQEEQENEEEEQDEEDDEEP